MSRQEKIRSWSTTTASKANQPRKRSPASTKSKNPFDSRQEKGEKSTSGRGIKRWISWQLLAAMLVIFSGSVGYLATAALLKLPNVPNCPRIFWPIASGSKRLYCAQLDAEKGTLEGLLRAMALVKALPEDHPLRPEIERQTEQWSTQILDLAEQEFQSGRLEAAISTAREIPDYLQTQDLVSQKIERWQRIWSEGEELYAQAERRLRSSEWNQAFRSAVKLTYLDNRYWSTQKYEETVDKITLARQESAKLDEAYKLLRQGGAENWLAAIKQAAKIGKKSYVYKEAQDLIGDAKSELVKYVQQLVENQQWQDLQKVASQIPNRLKLQKQVDDWVQLARAGTSAEMGTIYGLEVAIEEAEAIAATSSVHYEAQELIERWQLEIEALEHLEKAKRLARSGKIKDLSAAIAEVQSISRSNPRYSQARATIADWQRQIQTIEDRPILDQARAIASGGTLRDWRGAIAQARLIGSNRALYGEAQSLIRRWRTNIERQEDQPILDRATSFAYGQNYAEAIAIAQQISSGRALSGEASSKIRAWQQEIKARGLLQQSYRVARARTPQALAEAIKIALQVPSATDVTPESRQAVNRWGGQILAIANNRADVSLAEAIEIASMIPSNTNAYRSARSQIARWQEMLKPPEIFPESSLFETEGQEL